LEGWTYLLISILDIVSHTLSIPVNIFKIIDIVVGSSKPFIYGDGLPDYITGATSSIPLISLTAFLLFLTRPYDLPLRSLRSSARHGARMAITSLMITFIPVLVAFNEAGSFVGIHLGNRNNTNDLKFH
jgi:hypothetical protein